MGKVARVNGEAGNALCSAAQWLDGKNGALGESW